MQLPHRGVQKKLEPKLSKWDLFKGLYKFFDEDGRRAAVLVPNFTPSIARSSCEEYLCQRSDMQLKTVFICGNTFINSKQALSGTLKGNNSQLRCGAKSETERLPLTQRMLAMVVEIVPSLETELKEFQISWGQCGSFDRGLAT